MPQKNVTINTRQVNAKIGIIDIQGDVSATAEDALMTAYASIDKPETRAVILNFSEVAYMNSSGIGLLVTLLVRVNRQKQHMLCYGMSEHYQHIFKLTRLSDVIRVCATEEEALAAC